MVNLLAKSRPSLLHQHLITHSIIVKSSLILLGISLAFYTILLVAGFEAVTCEFTDENCEYRYYVAVDDEGRVQTVFVDENPGK